MTAATETRADVEHGVRFNWPGEPQQVVACQDLECTLALMDALAGKGVTQLEPVTRAVPEWQIDPAGLPAAIRHLAEAHVDEQVDAARVVARMSEWLCTDDDPRTLDEALAAWDELLAAIRAHREAEDGPLGQDADREQLVRDTEARITAAVQQIVGGVQ